MVKVLAIESSCDDTSAAVVDSTGVVFAVASQNQDAIHSPFGGIIPELACRNHTLRLLPLIEKVLKDSGHENFKGIDALAVTAKPGLVGALLVGITTAKTLALSLNKPFIGVDHLEGHLHAPFLKDASYQPKFDFEYPFLGLCVSGGHTSLYEVKGLGKHKVLGKTLDDAAGEAFDKFGKLLGFDYPAGAAMDRMGAQGNPKAHAFPRALLKDKSDLNFSFSGLKTSGSLLIKKVAVNDETRKDIVASYQEAIVDVLIEKLQRAQKKTKLKNIVITGGVASNSRLRHKATEWAEAMGLKLLIPPPRFCTDNAAMIGLVGAKRLLKGEKSKFNLGPQATSRT